MLELTIKGQVYEFNFGMGFMREINKKVGVPVEGLPNVTKNIGLQYYCAGVIDGDVEALVEMLDVANKGFKPRVTREILDNYIDDKSTDLEELFAKVLDFLLTANATKRVVKALKEAVEAERAKA